MLFAPGKLNRGEEQRVNLLVTERIVKYVNMTEYKGLQHSSLAIVNYCSVGRDSHCDNSFTPPPLEPQ